MSNGELERITRRYTSAIIDTLGPDSDVPAPDVNTNERVMAWIMDTYSMHKRHTVTAVVTGKPVEMGGSLGRREATGRGCMLVTREALKKLGMPIEGTRVAVQGFGNVGSIAAQLMEEQGMTVVAVSDKSGGIYNPKGLKIDEVIQHVQAAPVPRATTRTPSTITNEQLLTLDCDVLVPAALENVITSKNAAEIKATIICEGANGPTTASADQILEEKGVFVIPDILANAGGVTVSYFEWVQDRGGYFWDEETVNQRLEKIMVRSFEEVAAMAERTAIEHADRRLHAGDRAGGGGAPAAGDVRLRRRSTAGQPSWLAVGRLRPYYREAYDDYIRRLGRYREGPGRRSPRGEPGAERWKPSGRRRRTSARPVPGTTVVALARAGERRGAASELARRLERWRMDGASRSRSSSVAPVGLAPGFLAAAAERWSLGPLTLPHELARVVVAEQLYRGDHDPAGRAVPQGKLTPMTEWFEEWFGEEYLRLYPHRDDAEAERGGGARDSGRRASSPGGACSTSRAGPGGTRGPSGRPAPAASGSISRPPCSASPRRSPMRRWCERTCARCRSDPARMDLTVNLFTSFGYFDRDEEHAAALGRDGRRRFEPGGWFVIDFLNPAAGRAVGWCRTR